MKKKLKLIDWVIFEDWSESDYHKNYPKHRNIGDFELTREKEILIEEYLIKNKIFNGISGNEHQQGMAPVFNDNTWLWTSYRVWGDHMAEIFNKSKVLNPECIKYDYMDFYMRTGGQGDLSTLELAGRQKKRRALDLNFEIYQGL